MSRHLAAKPFSYTRSLGPGPRLVLIAALLFALWYTWPTPVAPDLADIARAHITQAHPWAQGGQPVRQTGHFGSYTLTFRGQREGQPVTVVVSIAVTADGPRVTATSVKLGSAGDLPRSLAQIAIAIVLATLVFFRAIPQTFGRKCPRDGSLLQTNEILVAPPRYDPKLVTRPGIVQRTWACRRCDFRHAEALPDPMHRPTVYVEPTFAATSGVRMTDGLEKMIEERRSAALARAVTDEQYAQTLADARRRAAEASSPDSPWRQP